MYAYIYINLYIHLSICTQFFAYCAHVGHPCTIHHTHTHKTHTPERSYTHTHACVHYTPHAQTQKDRHT